MIMISFCMPLACRVRARWMAAERLAGPAPTKRTSTESSSRCMRFLSLEGHCIQQHRSVLSPKNLLLEVALSWEAKPCCQSFSRYNPVMGEPEGRAAQQMSQLTGAIRVNRLAEAHGQCF